jgi:hypothetical protein
MITRLYKPKCTVKTKVYRYPKRLDAELRDGNKLSSTYVPLQTREHAWAGMSGMLRFGGARGALYVPRR